MFKIVVDIVFGSLVERCSILCSVLYFVDLCFSVNIKARGMNAMTI